MQSNEEESLRNELDAGEHLLWSGRPKQGLLLRAADALLIPFTVLWAGFAVFWEASVLLAASQTHSRVPLLFVLFGIPFVAVGAYITVGRFFVDARRRARTQYGLTNRRVLIRSGLWETNVRSISLPHLPEITLTEHGNSEGTIRFGSNPFGFGLYEGMAWPGSSQRLAPCFERIGDARTVYRKIRDAQAASR